MAAPSVGRRSRQRQGVVNLREKTADFKSRRIFGVFKQPLHDDFFSSAVVQQFAFQYGLQYSTGMEQSTLFELHPIC